MIAACGNGTAGAFAPEALRRIGAEVIGMDTDLDFTFPKYNPNPEDMRNAARHGRGGEGAGRRSRAWALTATATAAAWWTIRATKSSPTRSA